MHGIQIMTQGTNHAGNQMHHMAVAIDLQQIFDITAAWLADAGNVITCQINQHHMFSRLFGVLTQFQL